ncbi:MAG: glycosyltransferase family 39 protein [Pyrinomonadaceae bacterium]
MTPTDTGKPKYGEWPWIVFAAGVVCFYLYALTIPLLGPDEPRYAQVAREMFERGDWITPTLGGFHWFEKPALLYWLQIASYHIFGVNEFAARFGSALCGLGIVASLWVLGSRASPTIAGAERSSGLSLGRLLALLTATTLAIMVFARGASFDIVVTFPLTAALVSFFIFDRDSESRVTPLIIFYFFVGVAVLAKGLIGVIFPFAIIGVYFLMARRIPNRVFLVSLVWGTLLAALVAAVWYMPMYWRHGYEFVDEFFIQHHFARYTSNKYQHPQPFYFYLWVLPLMALPWTPFFLAESVRRLAAAIKTRSLRASPLAIFATSWLVVPVAFFSLSGSKLPGYILPAVPPAILIAGIFLFRRIHISTTWRYAVVGISVSIVLLSLFALTFSLPKYARDDSVKHLILSADARGMAASRVLTLHTISHNAEFYAPGRLERDERGRQQRLSGNDELLARLAENGAAVLVLVPLGYLETLTRDTRMSSEVIDTNSELAAVKVAKR